MLSSHVKIATLDDIMLDREVGRRFAESPKDFDFTEIAAILQGYDLVIANLENPVGIRGAPHPLQDKNVAFRCHPNTLKILKNLNVNVVSIANNHLLDYGEQTLKDTLSHLDDANIHRVGGGKDYDEANKPIYFNIRGHKIAILASVMIYSASTQKASKSSPGVADYNIRKLVSQVRKLKSKGCMVIVTIHWGIEYCFYPIPYQSAQAHQLIDAGAALILGHGPHYPQGIEKYGQTEIVHSLGNFIFDEPFLHAKRSFIYGCELEISGKLSVRNIYPVRLLKNLPVLEPKGELSKTGKLVNNLAAIYARKNKPFWDAINDRWFSNIVWRISTMHSWKFAFIPPLSFYKNIILYSLLRKINVKNLKWLVKVAIGKIFKRSSSDSGNNK